MGKLSFANIKKTAYYLKRNGMRKTLSAVAERFGGTGQPDYQFVPISEEELQSQKEKSDAGFSKLLFSILVPAYRTPKTYLCEMIESVLKQTYSHWELILADASGDDSVKNVAESYCDERIRYIRLPSNDGIAGNTNQGLEYATGDYVGLLDHDDILTENALFEMAERIEGEKLKGITLQMLYSDEDKCNGDRTAYYEPNWKEKFNLDLLLTNNYICHFLVMKRELMQKLMLRQEYDGAQDFDLVLRAAYELTGHEEQIAHIPKVLYHWRCHTSSTAENPQSKLYAYDAGRRAVQDFADRMGWKVQVSDMAHLGFYRMEYLGDIFEMRPELGAVGGPVIRRGKVMGGRMSESGEIFYHGLRASYSGYLHRAALAQDAEALDIRNINIRKELLDREEVRKLLETLPENDKDAMDCSLKLSRIMRQAGYKLLYLPEAEGEIWKK